MGCVYPIKLENKHYNPGSIYAYERHKYIDVPCGKCIQCIKNKTLWLQKACEYEYNRYGIGMFATLTYDDEHYEKLYNIEKNDFRANYEDYQLFIKRLRENLYRKYGKRIDFKYLVTTEYGEKKGRIHYHFLAFGLDWQREEYEVYKAWENGLTDCKPIDPSGKAISYVLKYLTKDERRNKKDYKLEKNEEAYIKYSKGLGKGFIDENIDFIYEHQGCYDRGDGTLVSLPPYWCNKLRLKPITSYNEIRKEMIRKKACKRPVKNWYEISKEEAMQYKYNINVIKEGQSIRKSRANGIPQNDLDNLAIETRKKDFII